MSLNYLRQQRRIETQEVATFTGEGAYHGSTRKRVVERAPAKPAAPAVDTDEMRPTTLTGYASEPGRAIESFQATFPNRYEVRSQLEVPSQEAIRTDLVTLCWCLFEEALTVAGPLTKSVLESMQAHLVGDKRFVYIDSKIQYFERGDVPVDSQHWHVDGSIVARGPQVESLGHNLVHDMRARLDGPAAPPRYLAYQSSTHCATRFLNAPLTIDLPELIPNFESIDGAVRSLSPADIAQPPASIVATDGRSLHRADGATGAGWRLWVRAVETDREVQLNTNIIGCYGTVFRGP